jgi:glycosyltransferase involved in cell wall biosynthesis
VPHSANPDSSLPKGGSAQLLSTAKPVALLLYSHFFPPSVGGVETIVLSLARGLAGLRDSNGAVQFEITLVTQTPAGVYDDAALPFRVMRQLNLVQLWRLIRTSGVVHVAGPALAPLIFGLMAGKPVVLEHHGFQAICPNGQLLIEPAGAPCPGHFMAGRHSECLRCNSAQGWLVSGKLWLLTFVRRFLSARAAANIAPTEWLGSLLHVPRIAAIPHGLEAKGAALHPVPPPGRTVIVFQGRLVTTKGVRVLLEAARLLRAQERSFELLIIGDGPERAALEQFASEAQLAPFVRFAGRLKEEQLDEAVGRASAVVVPSLGGEVFGLVVAENMLRGLPVIASDLGAFAEVLGDAGLTFHTGDARELAAALARVLDDHVLAGRLSQRARQRARDFCDYGKMIQAHSDIYQNRRRIE